MTLTYVGKLRLNAIYLFDIGLFTKA